MSKVTASAPNSLETLQKAVMSEVTVNWTELWTPPSVSRWDAVFRTWTLKKKNPETREQAEPQRERKGFWGTRQLYLSIRGGPDNAGSGETPGAAAQVHRPFNVLLHPLVARPYDLWGTFRLKSKVSKPFSTETLQFYPSFE